MLDFNWIIESVSTFVTDWPLILYIVLASIFCTFLFSFVQFRYFFTSCKMVLFPTKTKLVHSEATMSPLQAFINTLSMGLGNGSIAGVATSIYAGGPGSIFWLVAIGLLLMSIRFAEVYLSVYYADLKAHVGGPILYLRTLFAGRYLAYVYACLALFYANVVGNAIQTNAMSISLQTMAHIPPFAIALFFLVFVLYMMCGGAARILALSDKIVPLKVILFFTSSLIVLVFHWQALFQALVLIVHSAFSYTALAGGIVGYSVQQAMRFGIFRVVLATEAGLGTAGILFGSTESKQPMQDALMSLLTVFISVFVCMIVGLCIVASGVWDSGLTGTALTIAAFQTVFGEIGGWIVTILSISFGLGVMVSYGFVARTIWLYLTSNRYELLGNVIYCFFSCLGALLNANVLWLLGDIINAGMLVLNITAIIILSKVVRDGIALYRSRSAH